MLTGIDAHQGVICHIEGTDIPAMPKPLMFIYMKLEQKIGLDRVGYLTLSEIFSEYSFNDNYKECMDILYFLREYKSIKYKLKYGKKYLITMLPKDNAHKAKGMKLYDYFSYDQRDEIIDRLELKTEGEN